ncbi:transcription factor RFX4-like protein [Leptotrombidium deliense]|uniref:Transcription factor RFX4-like protein n=1 Tax=Leptotrombidium deliense TaxID=299467 RepID=A0A443SEW8_9ACAR|nr:transcription factor RFX4-like protein [Leptotrombidium deliense]
MGTLFQTSSNQVDATKAENLLQTNVKYQINCSNAMHATRSRGSTVLPDFPNIKDLKLPKTLDVVKTTTFLMMYRTHCQRILDTVIRANFDEVQTFVLHFWKGVPPHLSSILASNAFVNLIGVCDAILYKSIATVLLPSALQTLPDSLSKILRKFSHELDAWLKMALFNVPENLRTMKLDFARRFGQILRRQTSLSHLSQASRMVVNNNDVTSQMLNDWRVIDIQSICREIVYSTEQSDRNEATYQTMLNACKEFERLIEEDSPIESFLEWLDVLLRNCVLYPSIKKKVSIRYLARQFLFLWSSFASRTIREMTLHSASSFGSFHLLRLMFDDYILYLMEYINIEEYIKDFLNNVPRDEPPVLDAYIPEIDVFDGESTSSVDYLQQPIDQNAFACNVTSSEITVCEEQHLLATLPESESLLHENVNVNQNNDIAQQSDDLMNDGPRRYVVNNSFPSYGYQSNAHRVNRLLANEGEANSVFNEHRDQTFAYNPNSANVVYSKDNIKCESNFTPADYRYL